MVQPADIQAQEALVHLLYTLHCTASIPAPLGLLSSYLSGIVLWNVTQVSIMIMQPIHIYFVFGSEPQCILLSWVRLISSFDLMDFTQTAQSWGAQVSISRKHPMPLFTTSPPRAPILWSPVIIILVDF